MRPGLSFDGVGVSRDVSYYPHFLGDMRDVTIGEHFLHKEITLSEQEPF